MMTGGRTHVPRKINTSPKSDKSIQLLIDIQAALDAGKNTGYERWAKIFNLKQMAKTVNYLTRNDLTDYALLKEKVENATAKFDVISQKIKANEKRLSEIASLRTHIIQYLKTKDMYIAYRKNGYSKKFLAEHESEILMYKTAKKAFDNLKLGKLPTVASLKIESEKLYGEKEKLYVEYRKTKAQMNELLAAKQNVEKMFQTVSQFEHEKDCNPKR